MAQEDIERVERVDAIDDVDDVIEDIIGDISTEEDIAGDATGDDDDAIENISEMREILHDLAAHPRNINAMTLEELTLIPLLSERHAKAILNYRALYGDLHSMAELSLIDAIDPQHRRLLKSLFYATPISGNVSGGLKESILSSLKYGKHSLFAQVKFPLNSRRGFTIPTTEGGYRGPNLSNTLRYRFDSSCISAALTAAQDPGEPFFSGTNAKGWDFYTGFVKLSPLRLSRGGGMSSSFVRVENIILGDYMVSGGMGLVFGGSFRYSKGMMLSGAQSTSFQLRGHSSRSQSGMMRGAAMTVELGRHFSLSGFVSSRNVDATLNGDSTIRTLLYSGYHRTDSEIARRNTARETCFGGNITFSMLPGVPLRLGINFLHVAYSLPLNPSTTQKYNWYRANGRYFNNLSFTYSYTSSKVSVSGEVAGFKGDKETRSSRRQDDTLDSQLSTLDSNRWNFATCNSLRCRVGESWSLFAVQRYYGYRFVSLKGRSFGDVSNVQNESGVYVGCQTSTIKNIMLSAYVDYAYHPWYRYGHTKESSSLDGYLSGVYNHGGWEVSLRYRYRDYLNDRREYADGTSLPLYNQHTARLKTKYTGRRWWQSLQLQGTTVGSSHGWLASGAVGYSHGMRIAMQMAYYDTSDWQSRLYLQLPAVMYATSMAAVYGHGVCGTLVGSCSLSKRLSISAVLNMKRFFDRDVIGSGMQQINGKSQGEFMLQARWRIN